MTFPLGKCTLEVAAEVLLLLLLLVTVLSCYRWSCFSLDFGESGAAERQQCHQPLLISCFALTEAVTSPPRLGSRRQRWWHLAAAGRQCARSAVRAGSRMSGWAPGGGAAAGRGGAGAGHAPGACAGALRAVSCQEPSRGGWRDPTSALHPADWTRLTGPR